MRVFPNRGEKTGIPEIEPESTAKLEPDPVPERVSIHNKETKSCPMCGEAILSVARKCKHCGSMLDGTEPESKVRVTGADPFAELHTPIKGKADGDVTFIGWLGVGLGALVIFVACSTTDISADGGESGAMGFMIGVGIMLASYFWARKK